MPTCLISIGPACGHGIQPTMLKIIGRHRCGMFATRLDTGKKIANRYVQSRCDLTEPTGWDTADPMLVLTGLLIGDTDQVS